MSKSEITVSMPIDEYKEMQRDIKFWQTKFNTLKRIALKYSSKNDEGNYEIDDCVNLANEIEAFLNTDDIF